MSSSVHNYALKKGYLLTAVATLAALPLGAQARYSGAIGAAVPIGGAADQTKIGYQSALAITVPAFRPSLRLRIEGAIAELMDRPPTSEARRYSSLGASVVLIPGSTAKATAPSGYVIGGIGLYRQRLGAIGTDHAGASLGAGITFSLGAYGAFTEARLHFIATDTKTKLFPITFGLVF